MGGWENEMPKIYDVTCREIGGNAAALEKIPDRCFGSIRKSCDGKTLTDSENESHKQTFFPALPQLRGRLFPAGAVQTRAVHWMRAQSRRFLGWQGPEPLDLETLKNASPGRRWLIISGCPGAG